MSDYQRGTGPGSEISAENGTGRYTDSNLYSDRPTHLDWGLLPIIGVVDNRSADIFSVHDAVDNAAGCHSV